MLLLRMKSHRSCCRGFPGCHNISLAASLYVNSTSCNDRCSAGDVCRGEDGVNCGQGNRGNPMSGGRDAMKIKTSTGGPRLPRLLRTASPSYITAYSAPAFSLAIIFLPASTVCAIHTHDNDSTWKISQPSVCALHLSKASKSINTLGRQTEKTTETRIRRLELCIAPKPRGFPPVALSRPKLPAFASLYAVPRIPRTRFLRGFSFRRWTSRSGLLPGRKSYITAKLNSTVLRLSFTRRMPKWKDPSQMAAHAKIFNDVLLVLLGFYGWEVICGILEDWSFLQRLWTRGGKRNVLPTIIYFLCRYGTLISIIGINITNNVSIPISCQSWYTNNQFWGDAAIGSASTLLMLRATALWRERPRVQGTIYFLSATQWAILLWNVSTVKSARPAGSDVCVVTDTDPTLLIALYSYTLGFDFIILCLTMTGLMRHKSGESSLWHLVFADSILYCSVAFTWNIIATVFIVLQLNPIMEVMFAVPACAFTAVVACRSFRRLVNYEKHLEEFEAKLRNMTLPTYATKPPGGRNRRHSYPPVFESSESEPFGVDEIHTISVPMLSFGGPKRTGRRGMDVSFANAYSWIRQSKPSPIGRTGKGASSKSKQRTRPGDIKLRPVVPTVNPSESCIVFANRTRTDIDDADSIDITAVDEDIKEPTKDPPAA